MEILGINRVTDEAYNDLVSRPANILPWVQDTAIQDVWGHWGITYRDVLILDAFNRPITAYNLSTHDLLSAANRQQLKQLLLDAAVIVDSDKDGLPDVWEILWFKSLAAQPTEDSDGDGIDNRTELAFASNPTNALSGPIQKPVMVRPGGRPALAVTFRRFSSGSLNFVGETSPDLSQWSSEPSAIFKVGSLVNLYDGTGAAESRFQQSSASGSLPTGFVRVRSAGP